MSNNPDVRTTSTLKETSFLDRLVNILLYFLYHLQRLKHCIHPAAYGNISALGANKTHVALNTNQ